METILCNLKANEFPFGHSLNLELKKINDNFVAIDSALPIPAVGRVYLTLPPASYLLPALSVGLYSTPVVDSSLLDNIAFISNMSTATNKTDPDTSCMAAYIKVANTAHTTNNKIQGLLVSNALGFNCYDAYAIQGHIAVGAGGVSTQNANAHITGISGKALLNGAVGQGWVTGGLFILDGVGAVTGLCHGVAIQVEAGMTGTPCDAILYMGADSASASAIEINGTTNITTFLKLDAAAGCVTSSAITGGTKQYLKVLIGSTEYQIMLDKAS